MQPLFILVTVTLVLFGAGAAGISQLRPWPVALRGGLAAMFVVTGLSHFVGKREELIGIVPPVLPEPGLLIIVTGVLELAGAVGLLLPRTVVWAAAGLSALLVLIFPANIYAAVSGAALEGAQSMPLFARTLVQIVFLAATIAVFTAYAPRRQLSTREPSQPATEGIPGKRFRPFRRTRKVIGVIALTALGITLASSAANAVLEQQERSSTAQYGHLVEVAGGALNVVRAGTKGGQPLVLLSGFSTVAPALDFSPLIRELDAYDVIVVEGFGYGYSDMSARERTVENISTELHEALSSIDIKEPYVLAGHSLGGLYTLDYANRYPSEVSAVIGIDSTVPTAQFEKEAAANGGGGINITGILSTMGFVRAVVWVAPSVVDPKSDDYTPSEIKRMRQMTSWNFGNAAVADEAAHMAGNAAALREVTYPERLPVLHFLASDSVALMPDWLDSHKDQLQNVSRHEIVELEGQHYLHWTQSEAMADKISQFLQESVPSQGPSAPLAAQAVYPQRN